jgi:hypothetical protein
MLRSTSLPLVEIHRLAEAFPAVASETILVESDFISAGKTLKELDIRHQTGATVMAVIRDGNLEINPDPELRVNAGAILTMIGTTDQLKMAIEILEEGKAETRAAPGDVDIDTQRLSTRPAVNGASEQRPETMFTAIAAVRPFKSHNFIQRDHFLNFLNNHTGRSAQRIKSADQGQSGIRRISQLMACSFRRRFVFGGDKR